MKDRTADAKECGSSEESREAVGERRVTMPNSEQAMPSGSE